MSAQHHCELPDYLRGHARPPECRAWIYAARRSDRPEYARSWTILSHQVCSAFTRLRRREQWGDDGAQRARAIVTLVAGNRRGHAATTAVELTGVGPATHCRIWWAT